MKRLILVAMAIAAVAQAAVPAPAFAHPDPYHRHYRRAAPRSRYVPYQRPRRAFDDNRFGMYLGLGLLGDFVTETDDDLSRLINTGGGMDLFLGIRFSELFALEFGLLGTMHSADEQLSLHAPYERGVMNGVTLDGKFFLLPDSTRIEPFLQVGGGGYAFYQEGYEAREFSGGGFHLGGGVDINVSSALAFGLRGLYKGISMDNATEWHPATESLFLNQFAVEGNIQIHF